ncbi:MAG: carbohydrate ABC transporter permease [Candidatus Dormiibacterota bacterium]
MVARRTGPRRSPGRRLVLVGGLALLTVWTLIPIAWMALTSIKPTADLYAKPSLWPRDMTSQNYATVLTQSEFTTWLRNSVVVAVCTTLIAMVVGMLAAYAMTRLDFRGKRLIGNVTIISYLIPPAILFIPLFQIALQFHLSNKAVGLIPIYLIFSVPFCTWLAVSYFRTIPAELEEAALVDGANRLQVLGRIIVPLSLPALAVIALFSFTQSWNEFLFALILISSGPQETLPVGLANYIIGDVLEWGPLMAGSLLASLAPVLIYFLAQRWVVTGLVAGATKG